MKTLSIIWICLFPFLAPAQHSEFNELGEALVIKDSLTITSIRRISTSSVDRVSERLLSSYPELLSVEINCELEMVKMVYTLPITDRRLNQLTHYFK